MFSKLFQSKPKGIFFTNNPSKIYKVYDNQVKSKLNDYIQFYPDIITYNMLESQKEMLQSIDFIFSTWGMPHCTESDISTYFPSVKAVFYAAGSVQGFAHEFLNCGKRIFSAWGANAVPVAEYTVAQIILANKGYYQYSRLMRSADGRNDAKKLDFPGNYGTKVGIIGCGMIGSLVVRLLQSYKLEVSVFDPFLSEDRAKKLKILTCSLEHIFTECQTISNHLANNDQTKGMLNYELFCRMKSNATFINTGRGAQVVESDLIRALQECPDRAALLDVTFPEPPKEDSLLYKMNNVFLSPHIAGSKGNEIIRMAECMYDEFVAMQNGGILRCEVTPQMLQTMA